MLQKFFINTIESKFIKYLLCNTALPLFDTVNETDIIYKNHCYIYKNNLIHCSKTGIINTTNDYLYPSNTLYPMNNLYPQNYGKAEYSVIRKYNFGEYKNNLSHYIHNKSIYYDSFTHRYLGEYLRNIRDIYGINLMPFYNCFNYSNIDDIYLKLSNEHKYISSTVDYAEGNLDDVKTLFIPVKFNRTYTIAIDSYSGVLLKPILHDELGLIKISNNDKIYDLSNYITISKSFVSNARFNHPFSVTVGLDDINILNDNENKIILSSSDIYSYQDYLYLVLQVNKNNNSSIVVLEGDYTNNAHKIYNAENDAFDYNDYLLSPLSLLRLNDKNIYAFSNRLIEYLLNNVITQHDIYYPDIEMIQEGLKLKQTGIWDDIIRLKTFEKYYDKELVFKNNIFDSNGYVDKDTEKIITNNFTIGVGNK